MKILLVDDEPFHIQWIADNLHDEGYEVDFARDVESALSALKRETYRLLLVDLNIPVFGVYEENARSRGDIYLTFPGLLVAFEARNSGYRSKQVALYSAHKEGAVQDVATTLGIEYIVKQDPKRLMREINDVLAFDPTK